MQHLNLQSKINKALHVYTQHCEIDVEYTLDNYFMYKLFMDIVDVDAMIPLETVKLC